MTAILTITSRAHAYGVLYDVFAQQAHDPQEPNRAIGLQADRLFDVCEETGAASWTEAELLPFLSLQVTGNAVSVDRAPVELPAGVLPFANHRGWSDWHAFEVLAAPKPGVLVIRGMEAKLDPTWKRDFHPGGFCGHTSNQGSQRYFYKSNPDRAPITIRQSKAKGRKNGKWFDKGGNEYVPDAQPYEFYDFNF